MNDSKNDPIRIRDFPSCTSNPFSKSHTGEDDNIKLSHLVKDSGKVLKEISRKEKMSQKQAMDLFYEYMQKNMGLTKGGITMFEFIYKQVQDGIHYDADHGTLKIDDKRCKRQCKYKSIQSVFNGLSELLRKGMLARSKSSWVYFVNMNFFVKPDMIVFTESITIEK